jgi:hypothetical protein
MYRNNLDKQTHASLQAGYLSSTLVPDRRAHAPKSHQPKLEEEEAAIRTINPNTRPEWRGVRVVSKKKK